MAVTFGGDSISTDQNKIEKYVGSTITSDGVLSGGIQAQESKGSGQGNAQGTYKQYHPLCMTERNSSGQHDPTDGIALAIEIGAAGGDLSSDYRVLSVVNVALLKLKEDLDAA